MALKITIPGKSFVAGEYLALEGGPTLVAALAPRFTLEAKYDRENSATLLKGIHPQSPAGMFFEKYKEDFLGYDLNFIDPHKGAGGWGASTAQFAGLYALRAWRESILVDAEKLLDLREMLGEYRELCKASKGATPSGADLVSQVRGGLTYFDRAKGQLKRFYWPYSDIGLAFFRTGNKLTTHEHLADIENTDFTSQLSAPLLQLAEALESVDQNQFISSLRTFGEGLKSLGLVAEKTLELVNELKTKDFSCMAKGCGAMGADTLMVVYPQSKSSSLSTWANQKGLELVATEKDFEAGIDLKIEAGQIKGFNSEASLI